ncbi:hypothetical protein TVAG_033600 [Trichomonas vaginalis G3]|uniref:Uncharacterized protein n=1 Tax=Trichomonas vaginalis (strain ATCC PRA-98 / G3) TaxID=412133 RepID=A2G4E6_TRIV3|nr:hypothetical protein TVAGG3_0148240 [Trichomonas vaginalis G3]EAX87968.1 hypothetical protein TVAG_033600 [Trichomonas vaginalis G3]KAI5547087.1 hypothetical protein TVAGG3_0148240 [Trichomonas vaginalis G3]|eukprot:XP_001300898.1 hypothetical protein [Trichomonas vaginalis G3]
MSEHNASVSNSPSHSQRSSREVSPVNYPLLLFQQAQVREIKKRKFIKWIIAILLIFLSFVLTQVNINYCTGPYSAVCTPCPKHGKCTRKEFECKEPYKKISKGCYNTTSTVDTIRELSIDVENVILNKQIWSLSKLKKQFPNHSYQDLKAAIKFNNRFTIMLRYIFPLVQLPRELTYFLVGILIPTFIFLFFFYYF